MGPWVSSIADNLPVATRLELYSSREGDDRKKEKDVQFEHGYRLGFMDVNKVECFVALDGLGSHTPKVMSTKGHRGNHGVLVSAVERMRVSSSPPSAYPDMLEIQVLWARC